MMSLTDTPAATGHAPVERAELQFPSGRTHCAATFYRPRGAQEATPCVVMGHGFGGTRDLGLPAYAEHFAAGGLAALVFDYRHFGTSGGRPRQLIDIPRQLDDYRAAVRFARRCAGVDPERIVLWGTSLGGGHVLTVAAEDPHIAAVVAQVPFVGIEFGRSSPRSTSTTLRLFAAAAWDVLGSLLGRPPYLLPIVGSGTDLVVFPDPEATTTLTSLAARAPEWRNAFAARALFPLLWYRPGRRSKHLTMPLLICVADRDTAGSARLAVQAARQAPHGELRRYSTGHWDVYQNPMLERLVSDQVAFLRAHRVM